LRGIAPATEGNGAAAMVEETLTRCAVLTPHPSGRSGGAPTHCAMQKAAGIYASGPYRWTAGCAGSAHRMWNV